MPTRHRATAIGAMSTSFLVAGILGQVFAAWVALRWDWFWVFLTTGGGLVVMLPLIALMIKEPASTAVSPLGWEHINLSGDYIWRNNLKLETGKYRPLRAVDVSLYKKEA